MYKFVFYVPESHLELVKSALFTAGAGRLGDYDQCCWQVLGQGQFRPLPGAQPYIGAVAQLEHLPEYRVELVCSRDCVGASLAALRAAHPYEQPAYELLELLDPEAFL